MSISIRRQCDSVLATETRITGLDTIAEKDVIADERAAGETYARGVT